MIFLQEVEKIPTNERVYLDETGIDAREVNEMGYAEKGKKLIGIRPGRTKETRSSTIAAYQNKNLIAPFAYKGTMNGAFFLAYLRSILLPILKIGVTIILDNASFHKIKGVRELIESFGMKVLYLPPYSPDFNRIEKKWPQIKKIARELHSKAEKDMISCLEEALRIVCLKDNIKYILNVA